MTDYISGRVRRVVDMVTFELDVHHKDRDNIDSCLEKETVKLVNINRSILNRAGSKQDFSELRTKVWNKYVTLRVIGRDNDDRVLAYIAYIPHIVMEKKEDDCPVPEEHTGS